MRKKKDKWTILLSLIHDYAAWSRADEMKGGGDPDSISEIEAKLELARVRIDSHINHMKEEKNT